MQRNASIVVMSFKNSFSLHRDAVLNQNKVRCVKTSLTWGGEWGRARQNRNQVFFSNILFSTESLKQYYHKFIYIQYPFQWKKYQSRWNKNPLSQQLRVKNQRWESQRTVYVAENRKYALHFIFANDCFYFIVLHRWSNIYAWRVGVEAMKIDSCSVMGVMTVTTPFAWSHPFMMSPKVTGGAPSA